MFLASNEIVEKVDDAFLWIGGISVFLLAGITVAMVYFVVRYRRSKVRRPAQIEGHTGLEVTWIVLPTILVMFMFWKGYQGFELMRNVPPGAMEVDVIAQSWAWTFEYPEQKVSSDRLFLPAGVPVKFNLTSKVDDVTHSFYIPDFRVKEDCVPGRQNYMWIKPEKLGTYNIFCAEFCGKDHARMITTLEVLTPEDFEAWVSGKIAERYQPVDIMKAADPASEEILARETDQLYKTYCASCHGVQGEGGLVVGARSFQGLDGWKNGFTVSGIYTTLTEGLAGTQMRSFNQLPPWDRFALAHKVRSFYKGSDLPQDSPEALKQLDEHYQLDQIKPPKKAIPIEKAMEIIAEEAQ